MTDVICPYCGHEYDFCNDEGFEQDSTWEEECPQCEKIFMLTGYYVEHYSESKADCLNGLAPHNFKPVKTIPAPADPLMRCTVCETEQLRDNIQA